MSTRKGDYMNIYIHIGNGGTDTLGLVEPLTEAIADSPLHKHIDGCIAQINAGYSNREDLFLKDAETVLDRSPAWPESSESRMRLTHEGVEYTYPGFVKIARDVLSKQFPYPVRKMFLNYEPHMSEIDTQFDAGFRPFRAQELWYVDRLLAGMRYASNEALGHVLPYSVWNTPNGDHPSVDWDAVKYAHDYLKLDYAFINQYQQKSTVQGNIDDIRQDANAYLRLNKPSVVCLTPRDLGTPGEFSNNDHWALLAKLAASRWNGIDDIFYWMNADYIGDAEGNVVQSKLDTIMGHVNALGIELDRNRIA